MAVRDIIQAAGGSAATSSATYVEDVFSTYLYTGTGASQTITNGIDLSTKGGMVWLKNRTSADFHFLYDTSRGVNNRLSTNATSAQFAAPTDLLTAFGSSGFTLGADAGVAGTNYTGQNYASWTFRKQAKFFDVVTYTGTGSATTIAHSLGATPGMIIVKRTDATQAWVVYHNAIGNTSSLQLASTSAATTSSTTWNNTSPTSTQFTVGTNAASNASGGTYVAYLFADSNSGGFGPAGTDSVVACGSFTGTGAAGNTITLGWEPQYLLIKRTDSAAGWYIYDTMRGLSLNTYAELIVNSSAAETATTGVFVYPTANGFRIDMTAAGLNASSGSYIYLAIRRGPMKTPTDATKVFAPVASNSYAATLLTTGFPVDTQLMRAIRGNSRTTYVIDRLRGVSSNSTEYSVRLEITETAAEITAPYYALGWDNTGYKADGSFAGVDNIYWNFRRAPGFFDVVCYTGTGSATTVAHNLGVAPELMIIKARSSSATGLWIVWHNSFTTREVAYLNLNIAKEDNGLSVLNNTVPSSSSFTLGGWPYLNASSTTYVAYLFATCPGVSKVFNFTGNGSSQTINCGFASGARFVLIKRTDAAGDWWVYDSARGIVSAADPALKLNSTAAEVTSADAIDPDSSGFIVNQETTCNVNVNNATYIGLAIA